MIDHIRLNEDFIKSVRELIDELNSHAASGLMTKRTLVLANVVQRMLGRIEREQKG